MVMYSGDDHYGDEVTSGDYGYLDGFFGDGDEDYDLDELYDMMMDGVITLHCGCDVEPDGRCPCGNESPLLTMGLI